MRERGRRRLAAGVLMVLLGAGLGVLASWWRIDTVRVVGMRHVSPNDVAAAARLAGGERMLLTRLGSVEARVERLPSVRDAAVRRELWTSVVVEVRERVPIARLEADHALAVDSLGVVFRPASTEMLPVLAGPPEVRAGGRFDAGPRRFLAGYARFPATLRKETTAIRVGDDGVASLVVRAGVEVRFGRPDELASKAAAAVAVLSEVRARGAHVEYVDVRAPNTPVAKEPTPVPTARPKPASAKPRPPATAKPAASAKPKPPATAKPAATATPPARATAAPQRSPSR